MYAARQRIMVMIGGSFLLSSVVIFFGFHIFAGERGILARPELDRKIMLAEEKLDLLDKQHNPCRTGALRAERRDNFN